MTRRQQRYNVLKDAHFMPSEARTLSKISFAVPYMKPLIKDRIQWYNRFIAEGGLTKDWLKAIKRAYTTKGWRKAGEPLTSKVVFRMLKAKEREYKYKHKEYASPWEKKRKSHTDISAKLDATYEKYPSGRAYGKRKPPVVKLRYLPQGGAEIVD